MAEEVPEKEKPAAPPPEDGTAPSSNAPGAATPQPPATPAESATPAAAASPDAPKPPAADPEKSAPPPASPKPAAPAPKTAATAAAVAAKAAAPPPVAQQTILDNELVRRMKSKFGGTIQEAWLDRKQAILVVAAPLLLEIARCCRDDEQFDMLTDLTAVDWPRREKRFDVILNLYSFAKNERLRLKAMAAEDESVPSVCSIWAAANWLEREVWDMFGIDFEGHPDLRRILLPEEWEGFPLRKDYDILKQDTAWVQANLGIESGQ
jgi:NADH-quinone oxidoreductase subunit C